MSVIEEQLLHFLEINGVSSSAQIQAGLTISQPTASRLLTKLSHAVVCIGAGRSTRYGVTGAIQSLSGVQPIWSVSETGESSRAGTLTMLANDQMHIQAEGLDEIFTSTKDQRLPWYLSGLRLDGFIGRSMAMKLHEQGLPLDPDLRDAASTLFAALHIRSAPGSLFLGNQQDKAAPQVSDALPAWHEWHARTLGPALDSMADDIEDPVGAGFGLFVGGEQPKFLSTNERGQHFVVKYSPALETPEGDRMSDLLHAQSLASEVLARHGYSAALCEVVQTRERTYLLSRRFDRLPENGRRHVVSLGAAHTAFVKGDFTSWASTCDALVRQGRLSSADAVQAHEIGQFGCLIGNTNMQWGKASLYAQGNTLAEIAKGKFELAPAHSMLPTRLGTNAFEGYEAFDVDTALVGRAVRAAAQDFWGSLSQLQGASDQMRDVAWQMADQLNL